jgi:hypothetical protein
MNATVGADSEREEDVADVEEALAKLDPGDDDSNRLRRRCCCGVSGKAPSAFGAAERASAG